MCPIILNNLPQGQDRHVDTTMAAAIGPGPRFSKLSVITGLVKLFCFPFQMGVSKGLKIVQ